MEEIKKRVDDSGQHRADTPGDKKQDGFKHISEIDQQEGNLQHGRLGGNFEEDREHNKEQNNEQGK